MLYFFWSVFHHISRKLILPLHTKGKERVLLTPIAIEGSGIQCAQQTVWISHLGSNVAWAWNQRFSLDSENSLPVWCVMWGCYTFAVYETLTHLAQNGNTIFQTFYNLEKALDSVGYCFLLKHYRCILAGVRRDNIHHCHVVTLHQNLLPCQKTPHIATANWISKSSLVAMFLATCHPTNLESINPPSRRHNPVPKSTCAEGEPRCLVGSHTMHHALTVPWANKRLPPL